MYSVELSKTAEKQLKKLYKTNRKEFNTIVKFIDELDNTTNPKMQGKALQGNLKGFWRYRVGDYRIIVEIIDDKVCILVLEVGHRKEIYL